MLQRHTSPRIIAYHQAHRFEGDFVSLSPLGTTAPVTHLIVSAVHIRDDATIVLNDHAPEDPYHAPLWEELEQVRRQGVRVMAMVGGWAEGTTEKLEGDGFDRYYPPLRDFLRQYRFEGIDLDVEHPMTLDTAIRCVDALRADFGPDFIIAMAPVASALAGGRNLSGFDYEELERQRGGEIDFYMAQFYSGFARADDVSAYDTIINRGVFTPDRVLLGMIGASDDASFIPLEGVADAVTQLADKYPDFAGVDIWEFPLHDGQPDVTWWSQLMARSLQRGSENSPHLSDAAHALLPTPQSLTRLDGCLTLPNPLAASGSADQLGVVQALLGGTGLYVIPGDDAVLRLEGLSDSSERRRAGAYDLEVTRTGIRVGSNDHEGLVNALTTLRQLLPDWAQGPAPLPGEELRIDCVRISDSPEFPWRGMHLDVARHFMPLSFLYRFVDLLAMHKFNRFHLHLTDDQGWRFEVTSYPRLTEIGSHRSETVYPDWKRGNGTPHGGYYTQEQLKALVGYARVRGITIIPEIDVPGHVRSLLAAYPQFGEMVEAPAHDPAAGATHDQTGVATTWGVHDEVLQLTDEAVTMVEAVFAEVLDVFDSPWIHIGGDECPRTQWRASAKAAELAQQRGLDSVDQLQPWLTEHLRAWLAARGRILVGWDEILDDGEVPDAVVMGWRGIEACQRAVERDHQVIMCPGKPTYFDHYQSTCDQEPYAIGGNTTWQDVANFEPFTDLPADKHDLVLGIQGQVWTEYIQSPERVEYMTFPRASVLAQVAWTGHHSDPGTLEPLLRRHLRRLDAAGVNYRPLDGPHPWQRGGSGHYARPAVHREEPSA